MAPSYDRHLGAVVGYRSPELAARCLQANGARGTWLDVGAGTGFVGSEVKRLELPIRVVGVDISEAMLARAPRVGYVARARADVLAPLPFAAAVFDGALAIGVCEHVLDPARLLASLVPVLKTAAPLVFTYCPNRAGRTEVFDERGGFLSHDEDVVRRCLSAAGWTTATETDVVAYLDGAGRPVVHRLVHASR